MKIIKFQAIKVHGIHDFKFKFNNDISFLVGINGSGKTTILRLIQATLTLDFSTLFSIKFSLLKITLEIDGRERNISLQNEGSKLHITIDNIRTNINIPIIDEKERGIYSKNGRIDDYLEEQRLRFITEAGPQVQSLLKWPKPLFLGLERRTGRYDEETSYYEENIENHIYHNSRRLQRSVVEGLENCQRLLERAYQKYRRVSDGSSKRLINVIVESTFDYIEFDSGIFLNKDYINSLNFQDLITRRLEIEAIATDLGGGIQATKQINNFFSKITKVITEEPRDMAKHALELMLNRAQLQRLQKLLAEMDRQKKAAERQYEPISEFILSLNQFFKESKKVAAVDSLGRLSISQHGQPINLSWLSSGEKQLIILLAHARFARSHEGVIIVDEPELSLHLRWQEMLIDSISPPNNNIQFIFATHSPEIVGYKKENCISIG